jgi:neutral ceramidase
LVDEALNALAPAALYSGNGITRIAVNNRNNNEAAMTPATLPVGPSDYSVPTLRVTRGDGSLVAIVFGYACHPTALAGNLFSGDFTGFAQAFLEEDYPGATALYFAGCGGDQKAMPRLGRTVARARQQGKTLAAAVTCVLEEPMHPLEARLRMAYNEVLLDLEPAPDAETYRERIESTEGYQHLCNQWMLDRLEREGSLPAAWPVPVQLWHLGDQQLVTIGGEVMVEYALRIKERLGEDAFVMGYANDLMSYLPSERVLEEGGYEGASAQLIYGMPNVWKTGLEARVLDAVEQLARETE